MPSALQAVQRTCAGSDVDSCRFCVTCGQGSPLGHESTPPDSGEPVSTSAVGIDDIALHIPRLVLPMATFAELRDLSLPKLQRGLGLEAMAVPDSHEDTATMGANAVLKLIERNDLDPRRIGRIYRPDGW